MALVAVPVVLERAVETARITDALGTIPVEIGLSHNGRSTVQTGLLGDVYWDQPGPWGFGLRARVTEPPQAGGTLASYVEPKFIRANVQFVDDPGARITVYAAELGHAVVRRTWTGELVVWGLASGVAFVLPGWSRRRLLVAAGAGVLVAGVVATGLFLRWSHTGRDETVLALPDYPRLGFSSPQTLELARQVKPFIERNTTRIRARSAAYEEEVAASFAAALPGLADPRAGEVVVVSEADPQGSLVGTAVRDRLLGQLADRWGAALALRTISGDVTSNGTVAEKRFVEGEAAVAGLPVAVALGDHDAPVTGDQLVAAGAVVLDRAGSEVGGLQVWGASDVEHKALFGALVSNDSGITETDLGAALRAVVDRPGIVLLHQPEAVAGYLGVAATTLSTSYTTPVDDGLADVPAGAISIGHTHDFDGPWIVWNTDTAATTWTLVDQLGTAGGVEELPTFNRFSTPISLPLKDLSFRLHYTDAATGLVTGFVSVACDVDAVCTISPRTDVGLPLPTASVGPSEPVGGQGQQGGSVPGEQPPGDESRRP